MNRNVREPFGVGSRWSHAFTLVELLVSLGIISLLIAISLPAVQNARDVARRTDCLNRCRRLALGVQEHHNAFRIVATNGGLVGGDQLLYGPAGSDAIEPYTFDYSVMRVYYWGVGNPDHRGRQQSGSWLYEIQDFCESRLREPTDPKFGIVPAVANCPGRELRGRTGIVDDEFGEYQDAGLGLGRTDFCGNDQLIVNAPEFRSFRDVVDGLSHTILIGEKAIDLSVHYRANWYWDEPLVLGGSKGTARSGDLLVTDGTGVEYKENWGSPHTAGVIFAFADGRVQVVHREIDRELFGNLMTIDGGEIDHNVR